MSTPPGHIPPAHAAARAQALFALSLTMVFWGTSAVFLRSAALALSPENALALRYLVVCLIMAAGLAVTRWRFGSVAIARADWPRLVAMALAGFASGWFTIQGFARVAAGLGTVITMIEPIMISLLAFLLLQEPIRARLWLGLAISIAGSFILFWPDITASAAAPVDPAGVAYLIAASAAWALYTIIGKPLVGRGSAFTVTAWALLLSAIPGLFLASKPLVALVLETPLRPLAEIVYLAVFNTVLGTVLWNFAGRHLPAGVVGSFLYLMPVIAVIAGYLILDEPITIWLVTGGAVMLAGVAVAQQAHRPEV